MTETDLAILFVFVVPIIGLCLAILPELLFELFGESILNFIERRIGRH